MDMDNNKIDTQEFSQDFYDAVTVLGACVDGVYLHLSDKNDITSDQLANGLSNQMDKVISMARFLHEEILNKSQDFETMKAQQTEALAWRLNMQREIKSSINEQHLKKYLCEDKAA